MQKIGNGGKKVPVYRQWAVVSPKAVLLLVHGFGGHSQRWEFLANFMLKQGISSYALDLEGFGGTEWLEGNTDYFNIYREDIMLLYDIIKKENPDNKVFLIGESMGGLVSFLLAARKAQFFSGLVLLSPIFRDKLKFKFFDYIEVFFSVFFNPKREFNVSFTSGMCTRDTEYQKVMDSDKREVRLSRPKLMLDIALAEISALFLKNKIKIPVLFLLAGRDKVVDSELSKKVFNSLKIKDKTLIEYPDMFHAISIDLGREKVFEDILKWAQKRLGD